MRQHLQHLPGLLSVLGKSQLSHLLSLATIGTINIIVSTTLHRSCTEFFCTGRALYVYSTNGGLQSHCLQCGLPRGIEGGDYDEFMLGLGLEEWIGRWPFSRAGRAKFVRCSIPHPTTWCSNPIQLRVQALSIFD